MNKNTHSLHIHTTCTRVGYQFRIDTALPTFTLHIHHSHQTPCNNSDNTKLSAHAPTVISQWRTMTVHCIYVSATQKSYHFISVDQTKQSSRSNNENSILLVVVSCNKSILCEYYCESLRRNQSLEYGSATKSAPEPTSGIRRSKQHREVLHTQNRVCHSAKCAIKTKDTSVSHAAPKQYVFGHRKRQPAVDNKFPLESPAFYEQTEVNIVLFP